MIFLILGLMLSIPMAVQAVEVEKLIFDINTPTEKANYALMANFRLSLYKHNDFGMFGINLKPVYAINSEIINLRYGMFVRPIKHAEFYADRIQHINFDNGMSKGPSIIGVRIILFDR